MDYNQFYQEMNTHYYRANCYHTMRTPNNDATSGNHHVINGTYYLIGRKLGGYTPSNVDKFYAFVRSTEVNQGGLYARHPNKKTDHQTHDDYIGILTGAVALGSSYPNEYIHRYGENNNYIYDTLQKPATFTTKWNNWHGRFPGLIGVYKRAAGVKISMLDRIGYCAALLADIYFPKEKTDVSGRILTWLSNSIMKDEGKMIDYCIDKWNKKIEQTYEGKMGEVLGIYHGTTHPFSKAMWNKL